MIFIPPEDIVVEDVITNGVWRHRPPSFGPNYCDVKIVCPNCFEKHEVRLDFSKNDKCFFWKTFDGFKGNAFLEKLQETYYESSVYAPPQTCPQCRKPYTIIIGVRPGSGEFWFHGGYTLSNESIKDALKLSDSDDFFYRLDEDRAAELWKRTLGEVDRHIKWKKKCEVKWKKK